MKKISVFFIFMFLFFIISDNSVFAKSKKNNNSEDLIQVRNISYPVPAYNFTSQGYQGINYNNTEDKFILIPIDTVFPVNAITPVNSEKSKIGDRISFYFVSDFYYKSSLVVPAGSKINGTVLSDKKDELLIRFTNIMTSTGQIIPVSAQIQTEDGSGILKADNIQNVEDNDTDKSKQYTNQTGTFFNINKHIKTENGNVIIPQNTQVNIILNQPITVLTNTPF